MLAFSEFVANHSRWVNSSLSCGGGAAGMVTEGGDEREGGEADYEDVSDVSNVSDGSDGGDGDVSSACSNSVVHANVDDQGRLKVMLISKELRTCPTSSSSSSSSQQEAQLQGDEASSSSSPSTGSNDYDSNDSDDSDEWGGGCPTSFIVRVPGAARMFEPNATARWLHPGKGPTPAAARRDTTTTIAAAAASDTGSDEGEEEEGEEEEEELLPPASLSKSGISWGGQTFDGSVDGRPVGARIVTVVEGRVEEGDDLMFEISLPQLSAVLLTVLPKEN
jgi:hypothetical protein